jgi:hypothetical protein
MVLFYSSCWLHSFKAAIKVPLKLMPVLYRNYSYLYLTKVKQDKNMVYRSSKTVSGLWLIKLPVLKTFLLFPCYS